MLNLLPSLDINIPKFAFKPNDWTKIFLQGLGQVNVKDKDVLEIGVGTGVVAICLLKTGATYTGLDIDERLMECARQNICSNFTSTNDEIISYRLIVSDLFEQLNENERYDLICGCIPQVLKPETIDLGEKDSYARYFDNSKYQSSLNIYGLGLNEHALRDGRNYLKPDGKIVLVLSGRGGEDILYQMFTENGYKASILCEKTIPQLSKTTLAPLIEAEQKGTEFFFYEDSKCQKRITVNQAEERRLSGLDSFHKIYVFMGMLNG